MTAPERGVLTVHGVSFPASGSFWDSFWFAVDLSVVPESGAYLRNVPGRGMNPCELVAYADLTSPDIGLHCCMIPGGQPSRMIAFGAGPITIGQ